LGNTGGVVEINEKACGFNGRLDEIHYDTLQIILDRETSNIPNTEISPNAAASANYIHQVIDLGAIDKVLTFNSSHSESH
jgi:hypothetical protein